MKFGANKTRPSQLLIFCVVLCLLLSSCGRRSGEDSISSGQLDEVGCFLFIFDNRSAQQQLVRDMDQEEQRYVREGFSSDEELSLYDMLFSENLSKQDIKKIKQVAGDLLQKVKAKIAELDHWTDKQETKATIDNLIRDTLWAELPECYDELSISGYRQRIYEYMYTRYKDVA